VKPIRPLLAAVAAAGLLAAGCDYWQNLVEDKTATRTVLLIRVLDVWTGQPLPESHCMDSARGLEMTPDREGRIYFANAETGQYRITCTSPFYYENAIHFPLKPDDPAVSISLARRGAGDWYPDDLDRQVGFGKNAARDTFSVLRFPSMTRFSATPVDSSSQFRYIWKFAKASRLNRESKSSYAGSSFYENFVKPPDVEDGTEDTVTLIVRSRLNGIDKEYEVGTYQRVFTWMKNQPPIIASLSEPNHTYIVGCIESVRDPLRVHYLASDLDGQCLSVRFRGEGANSSLGDVDTTVQGCLDSNIIFYPKSRFTELRTDSSLEIGNRLFVTVTDDNGGQFETGINYKVKSNILPTISGFLGNSGSGFTGEAINVIYDVGDKDGAVQAVTVTWGEGAGSRSDKRYEQRGENQVHDTATWTYETSGSKSISIYTTDYCGADNELFLGKFEIRDPRKPVVRLEHIRGGGSDTATYSFKVTASDKDISEGLKDTLTHVYVNWGDDTFTEESPNSISTYVRDFSHKFAKPPNSRGGYQIKIDVQDAHNQTGKLDTLFLIP
jgi:hypothetical protein